MNLKAGEDWGITKEYGITISSEYLATEGHRKEPPPSSPLLLSFSFYGEFAFFNYSKSPAPESVRTGVTAARECCLPAVSFCLFLLCSLPTIKGAARIELGLGLCFSLTAFLFPIIAVPQRSLQEQKK